MPLCHREGVGIINFSPLAQGVLTGKYKPGEALPEGSRAGDPKQNAFMKLDDQQLAKVQKLVTLAQQEDLSMSQLALAWCLSNEALSSVIIGATKPSQVEDNARASGKKLSYQTLKAIDELFGLEST